MTTCRRYLSRFGFLGLALLVVSMSGATGGLKHSERGPPSETAAPPPGQSLVCFGYVDLEQGIASLYPLLPGRVTQVEVRETEAVKAGTVLLRLDDHLARLRVKEEEGNLEAARLLFSEAQELPAQQQSRLAQQRAVIEAAQHRATGACHLLARQKELEKIQQLNPEVVATAEAAVRELEAVERAEQAKLRELELTDLSVVLKRAQVEVDVRQAQLEQAGRGVEDCLLRAPVDGTVLRILVGPGDMLAPQPKQPAVLFCAKGQRIIRAEVEQEFARGVAVGQAASVQDDTSADGATWNGQVLRVSDWYTHRRSILEEPLQLNDVRTLECLIALDPGQPPLRIGQRVRVTIEVD
jgi:multidrug resistance efflux pump